METIEAPRPEAPPYNWPSHDLKNLVRLAPTAPYTRALLRIKFNCPVPDGATTFEQIEAWLATLKPIAKPTPTTAWNGVWTPTHNPQIDEIARGEYLEVDAEETGYNRYTCNWTKQARVQVPLSIWEEGRAAVKEYVRYEIEEMEENENSDYEFDCTGDDTNFNIESNLTELMGQADEMILQRDGEDEDEDEE